MNSIRNLSLRATISLMVAAAVVLSASSLFAVISWRLQYDVATDAIDQEQSAIAVVSALAVREIPGASIDWGKNGAVVRITADAIPGDIGHDPIDLIRDIARGEATIFAYDAQKDDFLRVATSIKKADGSRAVGTYLGHDSAAYAAMKSGRQYSGEAMVLGRPHYSVYQPVVSGTGQTVGIVFTGVDKAVVTAAADRLIHQVAFVAILVLLVLLPIAFWVSHHLTNPVKVLADVMKRLATDDLGATIPYADKATELGDMARALVVFRDAAAHRHALMEEQQNHNARKERRRHEMEAAIDKFRESTSCAMGAVTQHIDTLITTAAAVDQASRATADDADAAASTSVEAAQNVENVANAAEELTTSIQEITDQVNRTSTVVSEATQTTEDANSKVAMLAASASRIGEVVTLIQSIAAQTNLLALNATIEAARAGEAGKGFAVVATEVKQLADQTSKATEEIAGQVADIQTETETAVEAIKRIAVTMEQVNSYTGAIAAAVSEQGAATEEISRSISEASKGTRQVNDNIRMVAGTADATKASAEQVQATSHAVSERARDLSQSIDEFLKSVAA